MTRDQFESVLADKGIAYIDDTTWRVAQVAADARKGEIERILLRLHHMAGGRHNFYKVAVHVIQDELNKPHKANVL